MTAPVDSPPPLTRPLCLADVTNHMATVRFVANEQERQDVARYLNILSVDRLEADVQVQVLDDDATAARLTGSVVADAVQACVVTLEPVNERIACELERNYAIESPVEPDEVPAEDIDISPDSEEPAEPIMDGTIDVGMAVVEQLALELEPFPRLDSAEFTSYSTISQGDTSDNPFAALAALNRDLKEDQG